MKCLLTMDGFMKQSVSNEYIHIGFGGTFYKKPLKSVYIDLFETGCFMKSSTLGGHFVKDLPYWL